MSGRGATLWSLGSRAVSMAASILLTVVVARHFAGLPDGIARTGTWSIAFVTLFGVATVARFGSETLALRLTAADPAEGREWMRAAIIFQVLLGFVTAVGLTFVVESLPHIASLPRGWVWSVIFASAVIPLNFLSIAGAWLRALGSVPLGSFVELGVLPIIAMFGVVALELVDNKGLGGMFTVFGAGAWLTGLVGLGLAVHRLRRTAPEVKAHSLRAYLRTHGSSLWSYMLTALGLFFYTYLAVLFFGVIGREPDAAIYRNALTLANFVGLLSTLQVSYLGPRFAALHHHGTPRDLHVLSWRSTVAATSWGLLVALPLLLFPAHILAFVYHPDYMIAANILRALTLAALIVVVFGPVPSLILTMKGMEKAAGWITIGSLALALVAMILARPFGPPYVMAASTLAPIGFAFAAHVVLLRQRGIRSALWQLPPHA